MLDNESFFNAFCIPVVIPDKAPCVRGNAFCLEVDGFSKFADASVLWGNHKLLGNSHGVAPFRYALAVLRSYAIRNIVVGSSNIDEVDAFVRFQSLVFFPFDVFCRCVQFLERKSIFRTGRNICIAPAQAVLIATNIGYLEVGRNVQRCGHGAFVNGSVYVQARNRNSCRNNRCVCPACTTKGGNAEELTAIFGGFEDNQVNAFLRNFAFVPYPFLARRIQIQLLQDESVVGVVVVIPGKLVFTVAQGVELEVGGGRHRGLDMLCRVVNILRNHDFC